MPRISVVHSDSDILACFDVIQELRPRLVRDEFVARVHAQMQDGYVLVALRADRDGVGPVVAVAGYRVSTNLAWGRFMYVDDLVTAESARSQGHGKALLHWLIAKARAERCDQFHLDSGTQRTAAHRFYEREGLPITSHHFALNLRA